MYTSIHKKLHIHQYTIFKRSPSGPKPRTETVIHSKDTRTDVCGSVDVYVNCVNVILLGCFTIFINRD